MKDKIFDVAIIGGGIVGAATMYKLSRRFSNKSILLIEKEDVLADHQTGHNSGVLHSGIYYKPGSQKAINCVKGRQEIVEFAREHGIAHDVCGKIIVATEEKELPYLEKIFQTGLQNGIEGIEIIDAKRISEIEPCCVGIKGIWVPVTGIIDFRSATAKMAELAIMANQHNELRLGEEVISVSRLGEYSEIRTTKGEYKASKLIFCGGLQADRLAKKDGVRLRERVVGFRGDYYELTPEARHKVKNLIYPVPNPDFPFLGVHFTRMTNGEVECGPNAVFTFKREGYGKIDFSFRDTLDALSYVGTWKLFFRNMRFGINEYLRAFSKRRFLKTLQRMVPSLTMDDIHPGRSGVRALLLSREGDTRDDFRIEYTDHSIHVLNAPSPAATASMAIGDQVCDMAAGRFGW